MAERKQKRYFRLDKAERASIERALDKNRSARSMARDLGRSPASITDEVKRNRTIAKGPGKGERVEDAPEDACVRLTAWPWTCNGRKLRRYHCSKRFKCEYSAARAQALADGLSSEARKGVNKKEYDFERAMATIRSDVARGLSPAQIAHGRACEFKVHPTTIYRWIAAGYAGMSNAELRRKVGYKPRKGSAGAKPAPHGPERSYRAFSALPEEERARAVEMDTVIGLSRDSQCILTLYARPCKVQICLLLPRRSWGARGGAREALPAPVRADPHGQRMRVLGRGGPRALGLPRIGPRQSVLLRRAPVAAKRGLRAKSRRAEEAHPQKPRHLLRRSEGQGSGGRHEPAQLGAQALAHEHVADRDAQGGRSRGRGRPRERARHRGDSLRAAQPSGGCREPRPRGARGGSFDLGRSRA